MPLSQEHQSEFDLFENEIEQHNPADILQFAANYFNKRLEIQRNFIKNQEQLAKSKGIILFPTTNNSNDSVSASNAISASNSHSNSNVDIPAPISRNITPVDNSNVKFKSPFVDNDPHSVNTHDDNDPIGATSNISGKDNSSGHLFKGSFNLGGESEKEDPQSNRKRNNNSPLGPFEENKNIGNLSNKKNSPDNSRTSSNPHSAQPLPLHFNAERRTSVSGETINPDHFDDWTPDHFTEKTETQLKRLEKSIGKNFLFNKLDSDNRRLVINCLEEKKFKKGDIIIQQGDEGDYFYSVEEGTVEFYVNKERVSTSGPSSSFGELALMYNSPRAATVIAQTDCILWALDRLTFRRILLGNSFKKRLMYDDLLKSIPVLKGLTTYDRAKLADALDTQIYEPNKVIIKEGDSGENFYLIEYGECEVTKNGKGVVATLQKDSYFGEVALINDLPRQATVTTTKKTKVATLGKSGFQRLLGPVVDVLKLNDPTREEREAK